MSITEISMEFDEAKLKALRYYISKKETTVEDELQKHLEKLYDKNVPIHVKEYVQFQTCEQIQSTENKLKQMNETNPGSENQEKQSRHGRQPKDKEQNVSLKSEPEVQKTPGMTMSL